MTSVPVQTATANSSSTASLSYLGTSNAVDYYNGVPGGTTTNPFAQPGGTTTTTPMPYSGTLGNGVYLIQVGTLNVQAGTATTYTVTSMANSQGDNLETGGQVTYTLPAGTHSLDGDYDGSSSGPSGSGSWTGAGISALDVFPAKFRSPL